MRVVIALGGNALLRRGERPDADVQEHNVADAVAALAPLAAEHELVITHGNGPQVGVLALESAADASLTRPYPLAELGAETQGLIGFWLARELRGALPGRMVAAIVTQTVVDEHDPAFENPTKFVGPVYDEGLARVVAAEHGWAVRRDGDRWRRVVASPVPRRIVEEDVVRTLLGSGAVVVCAGGGGVPVVEDPTGSLHGVDAVIDKDLSSALLAERLGADALLLLTDVEGIIDGFGTDHATLIRSATPHELRERAFPTGSMGPKVDAVCRFVEHTGRFAAIGALCDAPALLFGAAGTAIGAG